MISPNNSGGKGFGGFSDLVSDVKKDVESVASIAPAPSVKQTESQTTPSNSSQHSSPQTETSRTHTPSAPPTPTGGGSGVKWFWGIAIGIVVLIAIGNSGKKENRPYTPPAREGLINPRKCES